MSSLYFTYLAVNYEEEEVHGAEVGLGPVDPFAHFHRGTLCLADTEACYNIDLSIHILAAYT